MAQLSTLGHKTPHELLPNWYRISWDQFHRSRYFDAEAAEERLASIYFGRHYDARGSYFVAGFRFFIMIGL